MLLVKSLHIIFMVTWMAGLFYLPRLFVYHAQASDRISIERFKVMERKLFWGIATPGGVLTLVFGLWLWLGWFEGAGAWLHAKLALVAVLVAYHVWCGKLMLDLRAERIDSIVCMNVLEHIKEDRDTLVDFASVLDPGGRMVLLVPSMPSLYGTLDELDEGGLIEELNDPRHRPADESEKKRFYRLTRAGHRALVAETDRLAALVKVARSRLKPRPGDASS